MATTIKLKRKQFGLGGLVGLTNFAKAGKAATLAKTAQGMGNTSRAAMLNKTANVERLKGVAKATTAVGATAAIGAGAVGAAKFGKASKEALAGEMGDENA